MPATRRGIYHNLKESKYSILIDGIEYFFSSRLYRDKFKEGYKKNREKFEWFFEGKELGLNYDTLSDLSYYQIVEKRGFRVKRRGCELTWQEARKLAVARLVSETKPKNGSMTQHKKPDEKLVGLNQNME